MPFTGFTSKQSQRRASRKPLPPTPTEVTRAHPHVVALTLLTGTSADLTQLSLQEAPSRLLPPQPPEPEGPSVGMTVIAEYNYQPKTAQDLELRKDEEYTILEMSDPNWWRAKDKYG